MGHGKRDPCLVETDSTNVLLLDIYAASDIVELMEIINEGLVVKFCLVCELSVAPFSFFLELTLYLCDFCS